MGNLMVITYCCVEDKNKNIFNEYLDDDSDDDNDNDDETDKLIVEKIPMSPEQFTSYITARDYEIEEASIKHKKIAADRFSSKSAAISSYRVKSRQISNFLIPEYALGPVRGKKIREKFIDKINTSDLKNLSIFSPKIKKLLQNIKNYPKQLG